MAGTFNALRSNDLIWSYVVNNWFMGKNPPAFDILAWNGDSTRMPALMHSQYLRACYLHNAIVKPGGFAVDGVKIDLGKIRTPLYVLGAESDHIALWQATYATTQWVGGEAKYTLTNSGHVAGIVNPPGNAKSQYWAKPRATKSQSAQAWRESATRHDGSWWNDWAAWIERRAGSLRGPAKLPQGEPAPGLYVRNETGATFGANGKPSAAGVGLKAHATKRPAAKARTVRGRTAKSKSRRAGK
jgi:polyhydroxyalkanoate synthase